MHFVQILQITGLLAAGCAMRFLLPYVVLVLETIGRENSLKAWPKWEWQYLTSFLLSLIAYGVMLVVAPGTLVEWAEMAPIQLVILAYAGQDVASRLQKPFRKHA